MCVVVGYASYSYCNEISQVQLYLKMLRLKHSAMCYVLSIYIDPRRISYYLLVKMRLGVAGDGVLYIGGAQL